MRGSSISMVVFNYTPDTNIQTIGDYAFADNVGLTRAAFNGVTPPSDIGVQVFGDASIVLGFTIAAPVSTLPELEYPEPSEGEGEGEGEVEPIQPPGPYELSFPDYTVYYYDDELFEPEYLD